MPIQPPDAHVKTLFGLQYLRGVAALMVAYFHMVGQVPALSPFIIKYLLGLTSLASGVDIFFVISGFIMLLTTRTSTPVEFLIRRIIRVVPLYWILTLCVASIALSRPELVRTTVVTFKTLVLSLLFIPYTNPGHDGEVFPILVPGWSLNFEMFFYVIFAAVLLIPSLKGRVMLNGAIFALLLFIHFGVLNDRDGALGFLTNIRIVEFWLGMMIAWLFTQRAFVGQRPTRWWSVIIVAFAILIFFPSKWRFFPELGTTILFTILPAAIVVLGVVVLEQNRAVPRWRFLALMGDASYSIYLAHILLLGAARALWVRCGLPTESVVGAAGFAASSMILVIVGSLGVYRWLEMPITKFLHRQHSHWRAGVVSAVG